MADSSYESDWSGFDEEILATAERNWENRRNRQFENSDIDSDWDVSDVSGGSSADESSENSDSGSSD